VRRIVLLSLVACQPPAARQPPLVEQETLVDLVGSWRWLQRSEQDGAVVIEDEQWRLRPTPTAQLAGSYLRTVEVRSTATLGFPCNQRPWYRQRALIDVIVEGDGASGYVARETGYTPEPSPCDHGFRHVTTYAVRPRGNRMELSWDGGAQTLWHVDSVSDAITQPWAAPPPSPTGAWRWQTHAYDDDGNVRAEAEWWDITRRTESRIDATYRRRVTVRSPGDATIACAGAPAWSFDDAYVLDGDREDGHWHFVERAVDAGRHPCLRATPQRTLDEATGEQIGEFLVLEWRGKRRQVLYRPYPE